MISDLVTLLRDCAFCVSPMARTKSTITRSQRWSSRNTKRTLRVTNAYASTAFAGTEPPPEHLKFDADRLREWVAGRLLGFDRPIQVEKFKGGQSNPTYR